jgi:hypothetical protein
MTTYDLERHIQLLKISQNLKNQKKNIFFENLQQYLELAEYDIALEEHIFWQNRYEIGLFIEEFLNRKIDGGIFCTRIYDLRFKLRRTFEKFTLELISDSEKIKTFQPDERSKNFSDFLTVIDCKCEYFDEDYENDEFYTSIKNMFLNFQRTLNEE